METKQYKIIFKKFEVINGHVEYTINLSCENDLTINFDFKDRYSKLKDLHDSFKKEADSMNFPKFPPKKLWGNLEEKFLSQRRIQLQHYFNTILGSKDFYNLKSLNNWINELMSTYHKPLPNKNEKKSSDKIPDLSKSSDQSNPTINKSAYSPKNNIGI